MKQIVINKLQAFFPAYPIEKARVFGSYARGEETLKSDLDVMVRFDKVNFVEGYDVQFSEKNQKISDNPSNPSNPCIPKKYFYPVLRFGILKHYLCRNF